MATTKRAKPVTARRASKPQPKAMPSAAALAELDDEYGYGPDDPVAEIQKRARKSGATSGAKRASAKPKTKLPIAPVPLGPLPHGMTRIEIEGHHYRTYGAVNVFSIGAADTTRRRISEIMYNELWPGEAFNPARLLAWGEANPTEYQMRAHAALFDAVFTPEGAAPLMSSVLAVMDRNDPQLETITRHLDFFNASASAR